MATKQIINPHAVLSQVLMETDAAGTPQAWYVYGLGLIGREDAAGQYQTYHYDLRGSTTALTDEQGQVTDTYSYDTYGEQLGHEGATTQPFQYNGRDGVQTDTNGMYQMRARYYNPEIKRFVNRDVLNGSIGNGLTMNRYAYVNGNPVSYIDPFGLSADGATWWQTGLSFAVDSLPFVGTFKGIQEVFTGVDMITGQQLSVTDRVANGVGTVASVIPFGKHIGKYVAKEGIEGGAWLVGKIKKPPVQTTEPRDFRLKLDLQLFADGADKAWKDKIVLPSRPHTNKTEGHWFASMRKAVEEAKKTDTTRVYLNKGLQNEVPRAKPNRPDVMVVKSNGKINQYEVPSKTDDPAMLIKRMIENQKHLNDRAGVIQILPVKK
ncbi:RHS repeat-associated core domain-containing protein [Saccharibacillus kuerlensis]|uniref:RHS repeat-associated core domain-containing protein n=1 Tax=Saccharibacillus kuerlensis TaxID=459527 RepID=UPI0016650A3B|nr:RHS repeat-associated core domain-containing protein [Saccharibacillus kuerlensis]